MQDQSEVVLASNMTAAAAAVTAAAVTDVMANTTGSIIEEATTGEGGLFLRVFVRLSVIARVCSYAGVCVVPAG